MKKNFLNRTLVSIGIVGLIWGCELDDITSVTDPETEVEQEEPTQEEESREKEKQDTTTTAGEMNVPQFNETKAFPSAEGFGRYTKGGRGGEVIYVTSLEDDGKPGTFRHALENTSGPRNILFKVSGIIELHDNVKIKEPYITIAGQTAPGSGITLKNAGIQIETHDVIIRHLKIRPGDSEEGMDPSSRDALFLYKNRNCNNIMLDRSSFTWGIDENVDFSTQSNNITIQNCIIAEGLRHSLHKDGRHSKGLLMLNDLHNISVVNNLFAHNLNRNPLMSSNSQDIHVVNNLVYNWGPTKIGYGTHAQIFKDDLPINDAVVYRNFYRKGRTSHDIPVFRTGNWFLVDGSSLFIDENLIDDAGKVNKIKEVSTSYLKFPEFHEEYMMKEAPANWTNPYTKIKNTKDVPEYVLNNAGASVPIRDEVDQRIIDEARNYTGDFVDSPADRGGYPKQFTGTVPEDTDGDGIPDKWEIAKGLDHEKANDASEYTLSSFYTNLEMYLNELAGDFNL